MGQSPPGADCNRDGVGVPLLNGPTEFGPSSPTPAQWTTAPTRLCRPGDLIFCVRGSTTGRMNIADQVYSLGRGLGAIRGERRSDTTFIHYTLQDALPRLLSLAAGSVFPNLGKQDLKRFQIPWPASGVRSSVAEVLGAIDDKIDSNRRLGIASEDLADVIVEAWARSVIPWKEVTFADFADVFGGSTPNSQEPAYWGGPHRWATPTDVTALWAPYLFETARTITDSGLAAASAAMHPPGSIFMTSRATIGAFAVTQVPSATNQGFIVVRPRRDHHRWFLYHEMKRRLPEILDRANGSTFMEISRGSFKAMRAWVPTEDDSLMSLHRRVEPIHARAAAAARECIALAALRDTLRPELLSGRLRAPIAREQLEDVV